MTAPEAAGAVTAAGASQLTVATSGRAVQAAISAAAMRDAVTVWPLLDAKRLSDTFPGWLRAMILIARNYHAQSARVAAAAYRSLRSAHTLSPSPESLIKTAFTPNDEWLTKAFGFSGPGMLSRDTARPNTALTTTLGTVSRIAQDGGRDTTIRTVQADPVAVGWYRLTDGHPCAWCALLASRGIAYKSERSAGFQAHNQCGCTAVPAFSRDHELPELNTTALDVYYAAIQGVPNKDRLPAFRKAWAAHQAS